MVTVRRGKFRRAIWQSMVIFIIAAIGGFVVNQVRPNRLTLIADWSPDKRLTSITGKSMVVSLEEARVLCLDKKAVFLDARSPELFDQGHIRCAQNIPWQSFDQYIDYIFETIPDNALIVTYCDGENCSLSEDLAEELVSMGYENVKVLLNGWTRWLEAKLPTK